MTAGEVFISIISLIVGIIILVNLFIRLDKIIACLYRIANKLDPPPPPKPYVSPPTPPKATCDCCHKTFPVYELERLGIGKTVCPSCKKFLKSK